MVALVFCGVVWVDGVRDICADEERVAHCDAVNIFKGRWICGFRIHGLEFGLAKHAQMRPTESYTWSGHTLRGGVFVPAKHAQMRLTESYMIGLPAPAALSDPTSSWSNRAIMDTCVSLSMPLSAWSMRASTDV